jgi:ribosomal protein L1
MVKYNLANALKIIKAYNSISKPNNIHLELKFTEQFKKKNKFLNLNLALPYSGKSDLNIAVIGNSHDEFSAQNSGIDIIGIESLKKALDDKVKIDHIICNSQSIHLLQPLFLQLGNIGLLPSKTKGTLTTDVVKTINFFEENSIFIKQKTLNTISIKIGNSSFSEEMIQSNIDYTISKLLNDKTFVSSIVTMGVIGHNTPIVYI